MRLWDRITNRTTIAILVVLLLLLLLPLVLFAAVVRGSELRAYPTKGALGGVVARVVWTARELQGTDQELLRSAKHVAIETFADGWVEFRADAERRGQLVVDDVRIEGAFFVIEDPGVERAEQRVFAGKSCLIVPDFQMIPLNPGEEWIVKRLDVVALHPSAVEVRVTQRNVSGDGRRAFQPMAWVFRCGTDANSSCELIKGQPFDLPSSPAPDSK